jgi:predicted nucleic acid-binding Zn ribbon protein
MPIYEYRCECGARLETLERVGEVRERCGDLCRNRAAAPAHGEGRVERQLSVGMIRGDGREAKEPTFDPCARSNRPGGGCGGDEY